MLKEKLNGSQQITIRLTNINFFLRNIFTQKQKKNLKTLKSALSDVKFDLNSWNVKAEIIIKEKSQSKTTYQTDSLKG